MIVPIVMVKNEEYWIVRVLTALARAGLTPILVADTGSTDQTAALSASVPGVRLQMCGPQTPQELGWLRGEMSQQAKALGADWCFLVDGDELYRPDIVAAMARWLAGRPVAGLGFTCLVTLDGSYPDDLWLLDDKFSRQAFFPAGMKFQGVYPFEAPDAWFEMDHENWYVPASGKSPFHGLHLHRLERSSSDETVFMRKAKRYLFGLQQADIARTEKFDLEEWWCSQSNP